jgi:hypothetical protein
VAGHADEKLKNHSIRKKYDNLRQPFLLAGGCGVSIIEQGRQLPVDVLLSALVSSDLHEAAIKAAYHM